MHAKRPPAPMLAPNTPKAVITAVAAAPCAGILATPARDDRGRPTVILTRGPLTRQGQLHEVADAIAEARELLEKVTQ